MQAYQKYRTINRTVLKFRPWWQVDWQSLPPYHWCDRCGGEVYIPHKTLCRRCSKEVSYG